MALFSYYSSTVTGSILADSPREAREKLRLQDIIVERLEEQTTTVGRRQLPIFQRSGRYASLLAPAIRDLSTLLSTGIGLVEALDTLSAQYKGAFRTSIIMLRQRVASGVALSEAMADEPGIYDELTVQMVRVGENSGTLDTVLDRLADFRERSLLFKDRIVTALIYPAIIVTLAIGVSIFLMTVVMPMLLENLIESGKPLPWPTKVLQTMSNLLVQQGIWLLLGTVGIISIFWLVLRTSWGKRRWQMLLFKIPLLGPLARKQEIARMAIIVSTLIRNGIVFVEAAGIAARSTKNILLREALEAMAERVQSGGEIGEALTVTQFFPPMVVQIFAVGQQTGQLEEMLVRLADGYERQVETSTDRLTAAIEPVLIVCLAVFVGFILFATVLPILEAGNVL